MASVSNAWILLCLQLCSRFVLLFYLFDPGVYRYLPSLSLWDLPLFFVTVVITHSPVVYPETKGVPLEEMDAVFGEGNVNLKFI